MAGPTPSTSSKCFGTVVGASVGMLRENELGSWRWPGSESIVYYIWKFNALINIIYMIYMLLVHFNVCSVRIDVRWCWFLLAEVDYTCLSADFASPHSGLIVWDQNRAVSGWLRLSVEPMAACASWVGRLILIACFEDLDCSSLSFRWWNWGLKPEGGRPNTSGAVSWVMIII